MLAKLLLLLAHNRVVTAAMIAEDLDILSGERVAMTRLRQRLAKLSIEVRSGYQRGYWLDERTRVAVLAALEEKTLAA